MSDALYKFGVLAACLIAVLVAKIIYPYIIKYIKKLFPLLLLVLVSCDPYGIDFEKLVSVKQPEKVISKPAYIGIVKRMDFGIDNATTIPVIFTLQNNIQVCAFSFDKESPLITGCSLFVNDNLQYSTRMVDNIRAQ